MTEVPSVNHNKPPPVTPEFMLMREQGGAPRWPHDGAGHLKEQRVETFVSFGFGPTLQPPGRKKGCWILNTIKAFLTMRFSKLPSW